jgi:hypothetical protein
MDYKKFFDALRAAGIGLTEANVAVFQRIINYCAKHGCNLQITAYDTATAYWESGRTCQPVEEGYYLGSKAKAFQRKLRYYPYFGRGLVQTTHRENYIKAALLLGLPSQTFIENPDLLLEWEYALPLLVVAMDEGLYTGKEVDDYIDDIDEPDAEDRREFVNARRVVNGTDKAGQIADIALKLEKALKAGGYVPTGDENPLAPVPETATNRPSVEAPAAPAGFWTRLLAIVKELFVGG